MTGESARHVASEAARRLQALADISRLVTGSLDPSRVLDATAQAMARLLDVESVRVWLHQPGAASDDASDRLTCVAQLPADGGLVGQTLPVMSSVVGLVFRSGRPLVTDRASEHPLWHEGWPGIDDVINGALFVPILQQERPIGTLVGYTAQERDFTEDDVRWTEVLAAQVAVAIQNARLYEDARRYAGQLTAVLEANARLAVGPSLSAVLDRIAEEATRLVGAEAAAVRLLEGDVLVRAARYGFKRPPKSPARLPLADSPGSALIVAEDRPVVSDDFPNDPRFEPSLREGVGDHAFRSWLGVPLRGRDQLLGVLSVLHRGEKRFGPSEVRLLEAFAGQAALAIENATSLRREQERRRQLEAVRDVTAEITHELDVTKLIELIVRRATELVDANAGTVFLWDEPSGTLVPRAWHGLGDWIDTMRFALGEGVCGLAAEQRQGLIANDYPNTPNAHPAFVERSAVTALIAQPILYQDRLVGAITVGRVDPAHPFVAQDLELLKLCADQAAIAIENARLFEQAATAEALRELARLKAEFLSTASHELRTPLTLIHGYAELLVHRGPLLPAEQVVEMAGEIHAASRTMIRLVDDLLDFSRFDQGRLQLHRRHVAVSDILNGLVESFRHQPGGHRIVAQIPRIEANVDPERIMQVVGNLLLNALRYAPTGPITVHAARHDGWLRVEVVDEGPGIPVAEQARIWERFYRAESTVTSPTRGSGLGLSVVKHLVELHGGIVGLRSAPGEGSAFWFAIPAVVDLAPSIDAS